MVESIFKSGFAFQSFSQCAEEMKEQSAYWSYEHQQYGKGSFSGIITAVHLGRLQLTYTKRTNGIIIRGGIPPRTTIIVIHPSDPEKIFYRGKPLQKTQVIALNYKEELEYHSLYPSEGLTVAVDTDLLDERSNVICGVSFSSLRKQERLNIIHRLYDKLVYNLLSLIQSLYSNPELLTDEDVIAEKILDFILSGVVIINNQKRFVDRLHHAKQAEDYLLSHLKETFSIQDICNNIGVSERTLHLGFKERYGVSPKAYLQMMRLNGVYQELRAVKSKNMVSQVAIEWGFNHFSRFSMQYKRMFGELPSVTAQKEVL